MFFLLTGCLCGPGSADDGRFDDSGRLNESPVRYEVRIRKAAATVFVNDKVVLVACETFSEGCSLGDLPTPLPRLRHHQETVQIHPYIRRGSNEIRIERLPDGDDDTLYYSVVRIERGKETTLAEGEIEVRSPDGVKVSLASVDNCADPPLPDPVWLAEFLDPLPDALRTRDEGLYNELLIPPQTDEQRKNRVEGFALLRDHPLIGDPLAPSTLRQDHRSVPLTMNYSCENERLFVYPEDGGDLINFAKIEKHEKPRGSSSTWSSTRVAELVYHDDRWYLGSLQSPETP